MNHPPSTWVPSFPLLIRLKIVTKGQNFMFFLAISVANDNNLELFFYHVMAQKHAQEVMLRSGMSTILTTSNKSYSKLGISQGKYMGMSLGLGQLLWVCVSYPDALFWFGQKKNWQFEYFYQLLFLYSYWGTQKWHSIGGKKTELDRYIAQSFRHPFQSYLSHIAC